MLPQERQKPQSRLSPLAVLRNSFLHGPWGWDDENWSSPEEGKSGLTVYQKENNLVVEAEVPGSSLKNVEVSYTNGVLNIKSGESEETKDEKRTYFRKETRSRCYRLSLPSDIDESADPKAELRDGIIRLEWPLAKKNATRTIPVS